MGSPFKACFMAVTSDSRPITGRFQLGGTGILSGAN